MDRIELLKELSDRTYRYFESSGLPPVKCQQMVNDRMQTWRKLPTEELQNLVNEPE